MSYPAPPQMYEMSEQSPYYNNRQPVTLEVKKPECCCKPKPPFTLLTDEARGHLTAFVGEFIGTFMFVFFGFVAAQTGNEHPDTTLGAPLGLPNPKLGPSLIQISYIASVFGLSLAVNVFVWYRVSGGQFNPAVSFSLWLAGAFNYVRLLVVIPAQALGSIASAGIVQVILPGPLKAENSLGANVSLVQGFFMEMILTFALVMTIMMLAVEKHRASFFAPFMIGITVLVIHLVGINVSGASVNPARTLGPAVINNSYVPEIYIYFTAPFLGGALAAGVHFLLVALAYPTANPGQDGDGMEYYRVLACNPPAARNSMAYAPPQAVKRFPSASTMNPNQQQMEEDEQMLVQQQGKRQNEYFGV